MDEQLADRSPALAAAEEPPWLHDLCRRTDEILWTRNLWIDSGDGSDLDASRLILPLRAETKRQLRDGMPLVPSWRRVSEQEARLAFIHVIEGASPQEMPHGLAYAIEDPTVEFYTFTGGGGSAQTDLALYASQSQRQPLVNIEFKSGGFSTSRHPSSGAANGARVYSVIAKDVAKLLVERADYGLWFHLLKNADSASLPNLAASLDAALQLLSDPTALGTLAKSRATIWPKTLVVHLTVLEKRYSLHRSIVIAPSGPAERLTLPRLSDAGRCPLPTQVPGWTLHCP